MLSYYCYRYCYCATAAIAPLLQSLLQLWMHAVDYAMLRTAMLHTALVA
jgi:hypothetical protein